MEAAEPPVFGSAIHSDTCALSVVSGTVKYETEPQCVKNSQALLEAAAEVGLGGWKETAQRILGCLSLSYFFLSHLFCLLFNCFIEINKAAENYIWQPSIGFGFGFLSSRLPKMVTTILLTVDLLTVIFFFYTCILFWIV